MKNFFLPLLFLFPFSALAQVDQPCTPQLVISYDAAGNRIQRREICDPAGNPGTYSSSGENFRVESPDSLLFSVSPNPGTVFLIQRSGSTEGQTVLEVYTPDGRLIRTEVFEGIRHGLQNRLAHDALSRQPQNGNRYPWMLRLERTPRFTFQFGGF